MNPREQMKRQLGLTDADFIKPLPRPSRWTQQFWEGTRNGVFLLKTCLDCGHIDHPPYLYCTECGSHRSEWKQAKGLARLAAFAINSYSVPAPFVEDLPYVLAIVELAEGPRMISNIVDCAHEGIRNGMELEVVFHRMNDEIVLPKWRPRPGSSDGGN